MSVADRDWIPIPDFNRTDADVTILSLNQNHIYNHNKTFDPWFLANVTVPITLPSFNTTAFMANNYINTMMCTEQYVLCFSVTSNCSRPQGWEQQLTTTLNDNDLALNPTQRATALRISRAKVDSNIQGSVSGPPGSAQRAQNQVVTFVFF